jgi:hypothetical protein
VALTHPPKDTRAAARSALIRRIAVTGQAYEIDWHRIDCGSAPPVIMLDPFQSQHSR